MILIDLQKAFDTIDHKILLKKMRYLGFSDSAINWFKSYLENRTFSVQVEDSLSSLGNLNPIHIGLFGAFRYWRGVDSTPSIKSLI